MSITIRFEWRFFEGTIDFVSSLPFIPTGVQLIKISAFCSSFSMSFNVPDLVLILNASLIHFASSSDLLSVLFRIIKFFKPRVASVNAAARAIPPAPMITAFFPIISTLFSFKEFLKPTTSVLSPMISLFFL